MHIGFTGSREGMTDNQHKAVRYLLEQFSQNIVPVSWPGPQYSHVFHDGDCIGSDDIAHGLALDLGYYCEIHPSNLKKFSAGNSLHFRHSAKSPLDRNLDIVIASHKIIATPKECEEQLRSGTWATIRYATSYHKPLYIVYPTGEIDERNVRGT